MSHVRFNPDFLPGPYGFNNTGVLCYFNSLLQCLLTCTSLNQLVDRCKEGNQIYQTYRSVVQQYFAGQAVHGSAQLLSVLLQNFRRSQRYQRFGLGQEDVHEGFHLLVDMMCSRKVERLFEHRFRTTIICNCGHKHCTQDEGLICTVEVDRAQQFDILQYVSGINTPLEGYRCSSCNSTATKIQTRRLTMVPEILVFMFTKFRNKPMVQVPAAMQVPKLGGQVYQYRLVAQSEHSGSQSGGHYWARALRSGSGVQSYLLNDLSVSASPLTSTAETYMVFYHMI